QSDFASLLSIASCYLFSYLFLYLYPPHPDLHSFPTRRSSDLVAAKRARLTCSLFDKGPVASSLMRYPLYMTFFSTPDKLEIGVPFVTAGDKPTRREALTYYRKVAEHFELDVRQ